MKTFPFPSLVLLFAFLAAIAAGPSWAVEKPVELVKVDLFAFDSIGIVGAVSDGEIAYKAIIENMDAEAEFMKVFERGTNEAKAYALHGLHYLNSKEYATLKSGFLEKAPKVQYIAGCIICDLEAREIIAMIEKSEKKHENRKKK